MNRRLLTLLISLSLLVFFSFLSPMPAAQGPQPSPTPTPQFAPTPTSLPERLPTQLETSETTSIERGFDPANFTASFYDGTDLQSFVLSRSYTEPIDFHLECFEETFPFPSCKLIDELADGNDWSVRWEGTLFVPTDGEYTFTLADVDDGVRLSLDGAEVVDKSWYSPNPDQRPSPQSVFLTSGSHNITIDYEQRIYYVASLQVRWAGPGFADEVIPYGEARIVGAWTADGNWAPKSTFAPGDPIQWVITVENTTGADADIELTYDVRGPNGEQVMYWNGTVTTAAGTWSWGIPGTVPSGTNGTHTFSAFGLYQGIFSQASTTYLVSCPSDQWYGEYYDNRDLQGDPVLTRCDQRIDFYWGASAPDNSVPADNFSVRWSGTFEIPEMEWYHFRAFTDDGLRLYVDGEVIIDDWTARSFTEKSSFKKLLPGSHQVVMEYVEWSNNSMAHLTWYRSLLCPNDAIACSLNITPMYQTQYLDEPMPSNCTTVPNQTIARWGCLITSIAMALQSYGIDTTPQELNNWLSSAHPETGRMPRGYVDNNGHPDACTGNLVWSAILEFAKERGVNLVWQSTNDAENVLRNEDLPVIMQVAGGGHYILATDVIEVETVNTGTVETLGIYDPHHAWTCYAVAASPSLPPRSILQCNIGSLRHATTELEENQYRGQVNPLKYLKQTSAPRTPSLQFTIKGVEVLLIDSQGLRVGYDPVTEQVIKEILNATYFDAEIVPPGAEPNGIIERTMFLSENAAGSYRLLITIGQSPEANVNKSSNPSDFHIAIMGFDSQFNLLETEVSGVLSPGEILEYQVNFSPGQELTITPKINGNQIIYLPMILKQ